MITKKNSKAASKAPEVLPMPPSPFAAEITVAEITVPRARPRVNRRAVQPWMSIQGCSCMDCVEARAREREQSQLTGINRAEDQSRLAGQVVSGTAPPIGAVMTQAQGRLVAMRQRRAQAQTVTLRDTNADYYAEMRRLYLYGSLPF